MVVPTDTAFTKPPEVTVAMPGREDVHVPPPGVPVSSDEPGKQMLGVPVTVGVVPTVIGTLTLQLPDVRMMFAVPLATPVTTPPLTVATPGAEELQTALEGAPVRVSVDGMHKVAGADGVIVGSKVVVPSTTT
jgi:hypothetical protein